MSDRLGYRRIRVSGSPYDRGRSYGEQAKPEIQHSRAGYEVAFATQLGWDWARAVEAAAIFEAPIRAAYPSYIEEMRGIADGSGLDFADILTMNSRTELLWPGTLRKAPATPVAPRECTSFGLLPSRTASGRTWVGQNWDWLVHGVDSVVVLEVEQEDGVPNFVTIVEAGLLAKAGMNSAGIAVATNALVSSEDRGAPGIPHHVILRALLDSETLMDAVLVTQSVVRASSANYLIGHASGAIVDLETAPGGYERVSALLPEHGALVHANHFVSPPAGIHDASLYAMPDSLIRHQRIWAELVERDRMITLLDVHEVLSDHTDFPNSLCCHPDPREAAGEQWQTVMSVIFEPETGSLWLADGLPCERSHRRVDLGTLLDKPSRVSVRNPPGVS